MLFRMFAAEADEGFGRVARSLDIILVHPLPPFSLKNIDIPAWRDGSRVVNEAAAHTLDAEEVNKEEIKVNRK